MKTTFAASFALFTAALATPVPIEQPENELKPMIDNKVKMTIRIPDGYFAYEDIVVDAPAVTVGRAWAGSSIDNNLDINGGIISVGTVLGNVKCVLQDKTRHDIVIMSQGHEVQDITGNGQKIRLTEHVVFCYTPKEPGEPIPTPEVVDTDTHPITLVGFTITNTIAQKCRAGRVTIDDEEPLRFMDVWTGDELEQILTNGHLYAMELKVTSFLDDAECSVYDDKMHEIGVVRAENRNEAVQLDLTPGSDVETIVDNYSIDCRFIT